MILDACFLIDLLAEDAGAVAKLDEINDELLVVPTLVYTEVAIGLDPTTPTGQQFDDILDDIPLVPYNSEAARRAVDIQRDLAQNGEQIGAVDVMIAGIAVARDDPIVTRNASEFTRTPVRVTPY